MLVSAHSSNPVAAGACLALRLAARRSLEAVVESQDPCTNPIRTFEFCTPADCRPYKRLQYQVGMVAYPCLRSWRAGRSDAF